MAGANLPITVTIDDREVHGTLDLLARRARHLAPALAEIGEVLVRSTQARFASESGPDGKRWAANSPVTRARKRNRHILTEDSYLGDLIHHQVRAGGRDLAVGSDRKYAAIQQLGRVSAAPR